MLWEGQREAPELAGVVWVAGWGGCQDTVVVSTLVALTAVDHHGVHPGGLYPGGLYQQWRSPQLRPPGSPHDPHLISDAAVYAIVVSILVGLTAVVSMLWQSPPRESRGWQGKGVWAGRCCWVSPRF